MNRKTAIRWWTMAGLLTAAVALADYVGVMADEDTGTVALSPLEARIANWSAITGTPTTVAGYGITDGATLSWVVEYVSENTNPKSMTNEPAFRGWTNIWHTLITNHIGDTSSNPHGITPAMIGAATGTPIYVESDPEYTGAVTKVGFTVSEGTNNSWDAATQTVTIKSNYLDSEADPNWAANSNSVLSHLGDTNTNPHGITRTMLGAAYTGDVVYAIAANGITNTPDGDGLIDLGTVGGDNTSTVTGRQIKVGSELNLTPNYGYVIGKRSGVTADNGMALGYRASVTDENAFVWSDASSDSAFNSRGSNTFSVRAKGGVYIDAPTFEITGAAVFGGDIDMQDSTIEQVYELHVDFIRNEDGTRLLISPYAGALYGSWTIETNLTVGGSLTLGGVEYTNLSSGDASAWSAYPATTNVNANEKAITNVAYIGGIGGGWIEITDDGTVNSAGVEAWTLNGDTNVWQGSVNHTEASRIVADTLDLAGTRAMTGNLNMGRKSITNVSEFGLSGNRVTLHDDGSGGGKIGITRTAGGGTTERYIGYRRIDVGRFGTYTNVGDVVPSQEFAYLSDFTNYLDLAGTRAMTGDGVTLARDIKSRDAASVGEYGAAFGQETTAGDSGAAFGWYTVAGEFGAAFGSGTTAGSYGAAFGVDTTADGYGAAFGEGTTAGEYGAAFGCYATAGEYGAAFGDGTTAGDAGFAAGEGASAGSYGFAAGESTSAGEYGFAAGYNTSAGEYGFAAGVGTSAGPYGFAAG